MQDADSSNNERHKFFHHFAFESLLLDSKLAHGIQPFFPHLFRRFHRTFALVQLTAHGACFLRAQVSRLELLVFVELPQVLFLGLVDHCQHSRDRLPHDAAERKDNLSQSAEKRQPLNLNSESCARQSYRSIFVIPSMAVRSTTLKLITCAHKSVTPDTESKRSGLNKRLSDKATFWL